MIRTLYEVFLGALINTPILTLQYMQTKDPTNKIFA